MKKTWMILIALVGFTTASVAAELVVIESRSGRYIAGKLIDAAMPIKLTEGETVTLLAQDGAMYKHTGPYEGPPVTARKADDKGLLVTLQKLVHEKTDDARSIGAVRSGEDVAEESPGSGAPAWSLLADSGGEQCVAQGRAPSFWRGDATDATTLSLKSLADGEPVELTWAAGASALEWPEGVSVADGRVYIVRVADSLRSHHLVLHEIPAGVAGRADAVAWLTAKGCLRQAEALLAELEQH